MSKEIREMIDKVKNFKQFVNENVNNNLSDEWTHDIVEYLQGYYGKSKNYNKLYKLIKEVVDMGLRAKSFISFREFLDYHNPKYHETNKVDNYKNLWWGNVAYLLGNTEKVEKDGVDETFMYEVIGIMNNVIDERQEKEG
jgi:site-specific DNA-cytosine methylase